MSLPHHNDRQACCRVIANKLKRRLHSTFVFLLAIFYLLALSTPFFCASQMNNGLNARANSLTLLILWQTVRLVLSDANGRGKRRSRRRKKKEEDGQRRRERVFSSSSLSRTVEKWKQNGDIVERKKRATRHFICFFQWHTVSLGHGHEHWAAGNDCSNQSN